jgi:trehalose utilization protein
MRVIYNSIKWAAPQGWWENITEAPNVPVDKAPEPIKSTGGSVH